MEALFCKPSLRTAGAAALITATALVAGCSKTTTEAPHAQVAEVGVYKVAPQALQITTELPGRTAAFQVAEVRPQVNGLVQKRLFVEGADVKAGTYAVEPNHTQVAFSVSHMGISPFAGLQKDMTTLSDRIAELETKLASLKKQTPPE